MVAMIAMMLLRVVLAWGFLHLVGTDETGIWWAFVLSWVLTLQMCIRDRYYKDALGIVYLFSLNRARADADVALPPSSGRTLACFGRVLLKRRFPLPAGAR